MYILDIWFIRLLLKYDVVMWLVQSYLQKVNEAMLLFHAFNQIDNRYIATIGEFLCLVAD